MKKKKVKTPQIKLKQKTYSQLKNQKSGGITFDDVVRDLLKRKKK